jgi:hypothetical protein
MSELQLDFIERIRDDNNILWMNILRIALEHAPKETKDILRQIKNNDTSISETLGKIADAD